MATKIDKEELKKLIGKIVDENIRATDGKPDARRIKTEVARALKKQNVRAKKSDVRRFVQEEIRTRAPVKRFVARLRYARISPRKLRYVADAVRGKDVNAVDSLLKVTARRGAYFTKKLLQSALGNATYLSSVRNVDIDVNKLHVVEYQVTPGPTLRRWRAASARRPYMIRKRTSHATLVLEERTPAPSEPKRRKPEGKAEPARGAEPPKAEGKKPEEARPEKREEGK